MTTFEMWSLVGIWFTGIATLSATCVALFISLRGEKVELELFAGVRSLLDEIHSEEIVWIEVTNVRPRVTNVSQVYWRLKRSDTKKYTHILMTPAAIAGRLPSTLADGQSVTLTLQLEWLLNLGSLLAQQIPPEHLKASINKIMVAASTSNAKRFFKKPEQDLIDRLYQAALKHSEKKHNLPNH
jgi:hypothetical protein